MLPKLAVGDDYYCLCALQGVSICWNKEAVAAGGAWQNTSFCTHCPAMSWYKEVQEGPDKDGWSWAHVLLVDSEASRGFKPSHAFITGR